MDEEAVQRRREKIAKMNEREVTLKEVKIEDVISNIGWYNRSKVLESPFYARKRLFIVAEFWWRGVPQEFKTLVEEANMYLEVVNVFNKNHSFEESDKTREFLRMYEDVFKKFPVLELPTPTPLRNLFIIFIVNDRIVAVTQKYWMKNHGYTKDEVEQIKKATVNFDISLLPTSCVEVFLDLNSGSCDFLQRRVNPSYLTPSGLITNHKMLFYKRQQKNIQLLLLM